ncbi:hypothetical protein ACLBR5_07560 [Escherichia coli]
MRILHHETNPRAPAHPRKNTVTAMCGSTRLLSRFLPEEMDSVFALPYKRVPHPAYGNAHIPAYEMIRFSVNIMRGCFGGCSFCLITEHEGRIIQSRSEDLIINEIERIRRHRSRFYGRDFRSRCELPTCICCAANRHALNKLVAVCRAFIRIFVPHGH